MRLRLICDGEEEEFELPPEYMEVVRRLCTFFSFRSADAVRYLIASGARWVQPRLDALWAFEEDADVAGSETPGDGAGA
ncbi:MAG: hypothetical protein NZ651_06220 [Candidatus Bipolaricaulota bacterium]|nr:hypothetical protein [Candidatus Bipolaricaulota bacterium]MDW8127349.1 hypothetical protein [Candidatus Bipolaricaulota bacterium]